MAEEEKTDKNEKGKVLFEREYIVPLRREWLKVQRYRRAKKAVKALKEFMVRHMKVYDRDLRKIKVDIFLNNEIKFRGLRKPSNKIKVKATKYDNGDVVVRLAELPKHIEFELARKARKETEILKKTSEKVKAETKVEEPKKEETADAKEKEATSKLATEKLEKNLAKEAKHTSGVRKEPEIKRKALKK